jgi:pimeloyl-ACP methyl ester carboxylesterase
MNIFPRDFNNNITGFGGDASKNQAQHRAEIKKTPVILVHGNAGHSAHPQWGMQTMARFLKDIGYRDCELWAMDYLGEDNSSLELPNPHTNHIDEFRIFVDRVKDYLGVDKLDFIAHSLGCGMVNGYLRGLQSNGQWNHEDNRFNVVSTFISLAGATYGLGSSSVGEFLTGSPFEINSHKFSGVIDDTPFGSNTLSEQISPVTDWKKTTSPDNNRVRYVAFIADNDFVDQQNPDTGRREGAHINKRFDLGLSTIGHENIIKKQAVFDAFKAYLNQNPPKPPAIISVDKGSGNYGANLQVTITIDPANISVNYTAERITKEFQAGFIVKAVAETDAGMLSNSQSLTLSTDGVWEIVFSASGAEDIVRTYGVNVIIPEVTILTSNTTPFQGSLEVRASATKGTLYYSFNGQHWNTGSIITITETATVYFIAIDSNGIASAIVSRAFEKIPTYQDSATGTLTEHFIAGRLTVSQYLDLGLALGFTAVITLYLINGKWVLNPQTPEEGVASPTVKVSADSGTYTEPVTVVLTAQDDVDAAPKIFYTLDGSLPTESSHSLISSGSVNFDRAGAKTLRYRAKNASGKWSDVVTKTYTMNIKDAQPEISADKPSGEYSKGFDVIISASDIIDNTVTVYYTEDGSDPSDEKNPKRDSFINSKTFTIKGNGNHSILCYAKDSASNEKLQSFAWCIDDQEYPETSISPSMGGTYGGSIDVEFSPSESFVWTKYTTDDSDPSDVNGNEYTGAVNIRKTTILKFRSKDTQGNLEPVKTAIFTITQESQKAVFNNNAEKDGYVKANADGSGAFVGTFSNLAVGSSWDNKDNRAILHFDTASLPDNAVITRAYLEIKYNSKSGDAWSGGRIMEVDVQKGYFGSSYATRADDWGAKATAEGVAHIDKFTADVGQSSEFSQAGMEAINRTGVTQIRLRMSPSHASPNNCIFIKGGTDAKLFIEYSV